MVSPRPLAGASVPGHRRPPQIPSDRQLSRTRRPAGKSWSLGSWLTQGAEQDPGGLSVYVGRSKNLARKVMAEPLAHLKNEHGVDYWIREVDGQLEAKHPNGHRIWLAGCKDSSEMDKFRGPNYKRVVVDEAQSFGFLRELVEDVFEPALIDKQGCIALTGTPHPIPAGYFYTATTGDGGPQWPTHHWTIRDNPYIPDVESELYRVLESRGWTEDHPTFQREYLGMWVRDDGALVFPYDPAKNAYSQLPEGNIRRVLSVDLGFNDATAFVILAYRRGHPSRTRGGTGRASRGPLPSTCAHSRKGHGRFREGLR